jgi:endoglucanase
MRAASTQRSMTRCALLLIAFLLAQLQSHTRAADAHDANRRLGRGINLGNALEAPREGAWGMTLRPEYFRVIREAGFQSVRIPVRWSAHAAADPPYAIDPRFLERIDWALDQARANELNVVLNVHHYEEIYRDPQAQQPRLIALWRQIASRYKDRDPSLYFEILNEPAFALDDDRWNAMIPAVLAAIRETNPKRFVIIGPASWNNLDHLDELALPAGDRDLIVTYHYYAPFEFTHQGAEWVDNSSRWLGTKWQGTDDEAQAIERDFDRVAQWAKADDRPIFLGEFGAYSQADDDSRRRWTAAVTRAAQARGFSWAYWEFGSGFGAYDREASGWRPFLLEALIPAGSPTNQRP